eukprot:TRINITY_DN65428_c0_g1_i2.p1 TRINITY_DN65428_c0_g1~~TRINITY_DN65428_c0_g1_i2.p1  ORF type:complete len:411 (-),score=74.18 TRINITY_DN65428_c0_g1_i2:448-1680(-)
MAAATRSAPTVSAASRSLSLQALRRLRVMWKDDVHRVTLADLHHEVSVIGSSPSSSSTASPAYQARRLEAAKRTHAEIKLRMAHRLRDFLFLPYSVMDNPSVKTLYEKYVLAYHHHAEIPSLDTADSVDMYWDVLAHMFDDHSNVTRLLGHARRQLVQLDSGLGDVFDIFLNRFYLSRIGTHLLGSHFLQHWPPQRPHLRKPAGIAMGVLQPTRPASFVTDLAESLSTAYTERPAPVEVLAGKGADKDILYIPSHLRMVLRETMSNAMFATARDAERRRCDPETVRVQVNRGLGGVFVTISDKGGGIDDLDKVWQWGRDPPTRPEYDVAHELCLGEADEAEQDEEEQKADANRSVGMQRQLLPLGFGLPLARITARYFGGDIRIQTLVGAGTNVYVHIPELQQDATIVSG